MNRIELHSIKRAIHRYSVAQMMVGKEAYDQDSQKPRIYSYILSFRWS